jgi:cytochrome c oxidase cbb3-type subunit II
VNNGRRRHVQRREIANAEADFVAQATGNDADGMLERYKKAQARDFDGHRPGKITEMDALIAYMQMLGTLVDTSTFKAAASR